MEDTRPCIILIAYYFVPGQEMGAFRPFRFYKYLKRMGYECQVITASEPAAGGPSDITYVPDDLSAVWKQGTKGWLSLKGWVEFVIRKLMFPRHLGIAWSIAATAKCREVVSSHSWQKPVLFSTYPPLGALLAGLEVTVSARIPWIADLRDPIQPPGLKSVPFYARFWSRLLEWIVFRRGAALVANTDAAADNWRRQYPWAKDKLYVICNGFDAEDKPCASALPPRSSKLVLHAGGLYHGRNPNLLIQSMARLRNKGYPVARSVRILLVGPISDSAHLDTSLCSKGEQEGWLELRPAVPRLEALRLIQESDALLLLQPQTETQVPGKLFEYICIGRPILTLAPRFSATEQVLANAGIPHVCVYTDDSSEVTDGKVLDFLQIPSRSTPYSAWFSDNFNAEVQAKRLASIVEQVK